MHYLPLSFSIFENIVSDFHLYLQQPYYFIATENKKHNVTLGRF